jgi:hypothetical protein
MPGQIGVRLGSDWGQTLFYIARSYDCKNLRFFYGCLFLFCISLGIEVDFGQIEILSISK